MILVLLYALVGTASAQSETDGEADARAAATAAAESWLALVDAGEWSKSWDEASGYFQGAVARDAWEPQIAGVRAPLGDLVSRKLKSAAYTESLPGTPDGRYVVIEYRTRFANKASAIETITPMFDAGRWRVTGYFIR